MKKLPIGIQTFEKIINENYIYVDKTKEAYDLINNYKYIFLSRPRRFGKSLFLDTLKNIFEGNKELFKGLYIYDKWDFNVKYPVINIDWEKNFQTTENLIDIIKKILKYNAEELGINITDNNIISQFKNFIKETYKKYNKQVVILINEYDKPICDIIEISEKAKINYNILKDLYTVININDKYIKFVFFTGKLNLSKSNMFSSFNNLIDISLMKKYGNICGFTQKEIEIYFKGYLENINFKLLKNWYNGFWFLNDKIYNPFDILNYLDKKILKSYWFNLESPSFIIDLIKKRKYFLPDLENLIIDTNILNIFNIDLIIIESWLFYNGYLSIKETSNKTKKNIYKLSFTNNTIKNLINNFFLNYLIEFNNIKTIDNQELLYNFLKNENIKGIINIFNNILNSISNIDNDDYYIIALYTFLSSLNLNITIENIIDKDNIIFTIFFENKTYLFEFKIIKDEKQKKTSLLLNKLKHNKYYEKYVNKKNVYLIGIEFSIKHKHIVNFSTEKIKMNIVFNNKKISSY